jgi:hypothetical protein
MTPERGRPELSEMKINSELSGLGSTTRKPDVVSFCPETFVSGDVPSSKCRR